ncbi:MULTISPECIES: sulfurtransferase TusA family protein [Shewanella]|uniref:Response regulator SirA n=2 Tax=Shewanella TaxID=22 RepID=A0ABX5HT06_9GAMM|nr:MULTISPECIES: sulfurtransferase TusA family protein [Shewanella]MCL1087641.1 sulfurtransferase TusA family protein [Shewanella glacialipiscicola]MCU7993598.1 sulfurtransferase TusA family protein [Shewanella glacialipiscicola]MCU8024916.1 sulfurtransferase TusA family protein [Shewanella glacialipiscicola]PTA50017.1 response regulator SirA [Shewanella morhuae]GIU11887.1 transcriptional regulator [Shewanella glacialipiscicola]
MIFIDLTLFRCPVPLVKIKLALKPMRDGEQLHILLSDSGSRRDVPQYLKKQGHVVEELRNDASLLALMIIKVDPSLG